MKNREQEEMPTPPGKLTTEEVAKIMSKFNDERLHSDEHPEYFTVHVNSGVVHIPKWSHLPQSNGTKIDIEDEIQKILE